MNTNLMMTCEEFMIYKDVFRKTFPHTSYSNTFPVCAYIFLSRKTEPTEERLRQCNAILKHHNSIFSTFRGYGQLIFLSLLATEETPSVKMNLCLASHAALKTYFPSSHYLPLLSFYVSDNVETKEYFPLAKEIWNVYKQMQEAHMFLTSAEDASYAGLIALDERDSEEILIETEEIYSYLCENGSFYKNATQSLSHALALCMGEPREKCDRFLELYYSLKDQKLSFGKDFEIVSLGIIANIGIPIESIRDDIIEVNDFLKTQKTYGIFGYLKRQRLTHAVMIVAAYMMNANNELTAAIIINAIRQIQTGTSAATAAASG